MTASVLEGKRILVTRPRHQAEVLCSLLEQQGGVPIRFPVLEIIANTHGKIQEKLKQFETYQWLIFVSANAVNFALQANDGRIEPFKNKRIAVVGKATANSLKNKGLNVDVLPAAGFTSEALLAMPSMQQLNGMNCLIIRGQGGREYLADELRNRGATVDYLEVYKRQRPKCDNTQIMKLIEGNKLNAVMITSGEALQNLLKMLDVECHLKLMSIPLAVVSMRLKQMAEKFGFKQVAVSDNPSDSAMIQTVTSLINGEYSG